MRSRYEESCTYKGCWLPGIDLHYAPESSLPPSRRGRNEGKDCGKLCPCVLRVISRDQQVKAEQEAGDVEMLRSREAKVRGEVKGGRWRSLASPPRKPFDNTRLHRQRDFSAKRYQFMSSYIYTVQ